MKKKYNSYPFIENLNDDFNYIQLNEQLSDGAIDLIIKAKDGTNVNVYSAGLWHILISDEFANEGFILSLPLLKIFIAGLIIRK